MIKLYIKPFNKFGKNRGGYKYFYKMAYQKIKQISLFEYFSIIKDIYTYILLKFLYKE